MTSTKMLIVQHELLCLDSKQVVGGRLAKTSQFMMNPRNTDKKMLIH